MDPKNPYANSKVSQSLDDSVTDEIEMTEQIKSLITPRHLFKEL